MSALPQFTTRFEQLGVPPPFIDGVKGTGKQFADRLDQPRVPLHNDPYLVGTLPTEQPNIRPRVMPGVGLSERIDWQKLNREARRGSALKGLEDGYVIDDRPAVEAFIEQNRLRGLLQQAREPLNAAFAEWAVKKLTLAEDDEGFTTLFCLVLIPGDMRAARLALKSFDEHWWLARSAQPRGKLNFDFELI
jgi:hypothetical protein